MFPQNTESDLRVTDVWSELTEPVNFSLIKFGEISPFAGCAGAGVGVGFAAGLGVDFGVCCTRFGRGTGLLRRFFTEFGFRCGVAFRVPAFLGRRGTFCLPLTFRRCFAGDFFCGFLGFDAACC